MHNDDGTLRAYLDGEVSPEVRAAIATHLESCDACRARLAGLSRQAEMAARHLAALAPRPGETASPAPVALARFQLTKLPHPPSSPTVVGGGLGVRAWRNRMKSLWSSHRLLWTGLAAVLVLAALFSLTPVRTAAGQFLGLFRVRKFAVLPINPAQSQLQDPEVATRIDRLLSDEVTVVKQAGPPQTVASVAEASQKANMPLRLPATLPNGTDPTPRIQVQDSSAVRFKVDLARAQAVLDLLQINDVKLPQALDGATITAEVPPAVMVRYSTILGDFTLTQMRSPTVDLPPGVDLAQIGEAGLRLLGLSPEEAHQFSRTIDWSSTLVIPLPTDAASFRDVTVDGVSGVLISERRSTSAPSSSYLLLWQKDDIVYALAARGNAEQILATANSLQ